MIAVRLRAMARAIVADAAERAAALDAAADEVERGEDALVSIEAGAASLGITPRQLRDDLRRRGVPVEKVGGTCFVRRASLTRTAVPTARATAANDSREVEPDERAEARAAVARAAARAAK